MTGDEEADDIIEAAEADADIAAALLRVAEAGERLLASGLTKRAIVVLLKDRLGQMQKRDIERVLDALPALKSYLSEGDS